jgi:hypothetical protein
MTTCSRGRTCLLSEHVYVRTYRAHCSSTCRECPRVQNVVVRDHGVAGPSCHQSWFASQLTVRLLHHIRNDPLQWSLLTGRYLSCTRSYRRSPCQRRRRGITSEIDRRRYLHVRRSCVWEAAASQQTRHGTVVRPPGSSHARASGWQQRTHQERAAERATQITSLRSSQSSRRRAKRGEARGTDRSRTRALPLPVVPTPRRRPARGEGAPLPPVPAPFPNWAALPASATHVGVGCRPRVSNSGLSVRSQLAVNIARHMTTRLHAMSVCARRPQRDAAGSHGVAAQAERASERCRVQRAPAVLPLHAV